jgi:GTP-binding protein EngB required for normal cell division
MFESYLQSETLYNRIVCVVIEAKMELNHYDHLILKMLDKHQVPYQVILTKMDKFAPQLWPTLLDAQENELCSYLTKYGSNSLPHIILTSSLHNKTGFELLKCSILESAINAN